VGVFTGPPTFTPSSIAADTEGFLGGGQVGCDYQFDPRWVIGVEGQFSWTDISGSTSGARTPSPFTSISATFNAKTNWLASATARIGYALDPRWLLYVKGGAAWEHDKYNVQTLTLSLAGPQKPASAGLSAAVSNGLSPVIGRPSSNISFMISAARN
jgi:outer membrane immunogenic protein